MTIRYELWGITRSFYQKLIGGPFEVDEQKSLVATFSSKKILNNFLQARLLKNEIPFSGFEPGRKFKKNTDMWIYNDFEVVEIKQQESIVIPHDPE